MFIIFTKDQDNIQVSKSKRKTFKDFISQLLNVQEPVLKQRYFLEFKLPNQEFQKQISFVFQVKAQSDGILNYNQMMNS